MTSLILFAIGTGAAGFIVGALLVHWAYRPVRYERAESETVPVKVTSTRPKPLHSTKPKLSEATYRGYQPRYNIPPEEFEKLFNQGDAHDGR